MSVTSSVNSINSSLAPTASSATAAAATTAATNTLNYDDFLNILMTELQHQDPTQPMDPTQMVTQLATVSGVGQQVQTNQTLSSLLTSTALSQADLMIGQTVTSADGKTSGVVSSVTVSSTGTTATLANGSKVSITNGVQIQ